MWNIIFELMAYVLISICCYRVAKLYGSKFLKAISDLRFNELKYGHALVSDRLDYCRYLSASILWEIAVVFSVYQAVKVVSHLFN